VQTWTFYIVQYYFNMRIRSDIFIISIRELDSISELDIACM